jgi:hypothetical protein
MKLYVGGINMVSAYMTIVATELRIAGDPSTLACSGHIFRPVRIFLNKSIFSHDH